MCLSLLLLDQNKGLLFLIQQMYVAEPEMKRAVCLSRRFSPLESQGEKKTTSKQRLAKISVYGHPNIISPVKFFFLFPFFLFSPCSPQPQPLPSQCKSCLCSALTRCSSSPYPSKRLRRSADSGLCWPASERRVSVDVPSKQQAARVSKSEERRPINAAVPSLSLCAAVILKTLKATK